MYRLSLKTLPLCAAVCVVALAGASPARRARPAASPQTRVPLRFTGEHKQNLVFPYYCIEGEATMDIKDDGQFVIYVTGRRRITGRITGSKIVQMSPGSDKVIPTGELVVNGPDGTPAFTIPLTPYSSEEAVGPVSQIKLLNKGGLTTTCFRFCPPNDEQCQDSSHVIKCAGLTKCRNKIRQTPAAAPPEPETPPFVR